MMNQPSFILTYLIGLVGAILLTAICLMVMVTEYIPLLLVNPMIIGGLFAFLFGLSVAEIPVMVFGLRAMSHSSNPNAKYALWFTQAAYPFFAGVYAGVFILLTGYLSLGTLLGALSILRFISAMLFLRPKNA